MSKLQLLLHEGCVSAHILYLPSKAGLTHSWRCSRVRKVAP